jgi:hypothetical protein
MVSRFDNHTGTAYKRIITAAVKKLAQGWGEEWPMTDRTTVESCE